MKILTHEFMVTAVLPLIAYEARYTHHSMPDGDLQLVSTRIDPITISYYGPATPGGSPVVKFQDVAGREAWGSVEMYFENAADAQVEIDEAWVDAKANPPYSVLKAERDERQVEIERLRGLLGSATSLAVAMIMARDDGFDALSGFFTEGELENIFTLVGDIENAGTSLRRCFDAAQGERPGARSYDHSELQAALKQGQKGGTIHAQ